MSVTATDYVTETAAIIEKLRRAADYIVASREKGAYDDLERPLMSRREAKRVFQLLQVTMTIEQMVECLTEEIRHAADFLDACASGILEGGRDGDRDLCERCSAAYSILIAPAGPLADFLQRLPLKTAAGAAPLVEANDHELELRPLWGPQRGFCSRRGVKRR